MLITGIRPSVPLAIGGMSRRILLMAMTWLAVLPASPTASAADPIAGFPNKPIRVIHGFAAGGDVFTRMLAAKLSDSWKQQLVVDNRPGAGGIIGAQIVANANADGYTLLSVTPAHAVAPSMYSKLPYDTIKDFAGVAAIAGVPAVLVVNHALGVKSVSGLIALAKSKPGQLNFASAGVGSATHFSAELFRSLAGIDVVHVPYKGIPEALTDTMTGRVQYFLCPLYAVLSFINEGKVLALGVSTQKQRAALLPDVPTIAEAGLPGYEWSLWYGFLAPAKTPRPLIARLNRDITRILDLPDMRQRWSALGAEPLPMTPEQFDKFIAEQVGLFSKLTRAAGIKAS
jgi:tripartite-type tricarboxylate transporter receptor subunit TctC